MEKGRGGEGIRGYRRQADRTLLLRQTDHTNEVSSRFSTFPRVSRPLRVAFGDRRVCVKEPAVNSKVEEELIAVAAEWDRAMVENDAEAIGLYMADDWAFLDPNGGVTDKATYLG